MNYSTRYVRYRWIVLACAFATMQGGLFGASTIQTAVTAPLYLPAAYHTAPLFPTTVNNITSMVGQEKPPITSVIKSLWQPSILFEKSMSWAINNPFKTAAFTLLGTFLLYHFYKKNGPAQLVAHDDDALPTLLNNDVNSEREAALSYTIEEKTLPAFINNPSSTLIKNEPYSPECANWQELLSENYLPTFLINSANSILTINYVCDKKVPGGFQNLINTCYLNATLSCLLKNDEIRKKLLSLKLTMPYTSQETIFYQKQLSGLEKTNLDDEKKQCTTWLNRAQEEDEKKTKLRSLLGQLAQAIENDPKNPIAPTDLMNYLIQENLFKKNEPDDSITVLELFAKALPELFQFTQRTTITHTCDQQKNHALNDQVGVLTLSIKNDCTLNEAVTSSLTEEVIQGGKCEYNNTCTRHQKIDLAWNKRTEAPLFVAINIKSPYKETPRKVTIPETITLQGIRTKNHQIPSKSRVRYKLCGLIKHSGGHYTSLVKTTEGWYNFNDSSVTLKTEKELTELLKNTTNYRGAIYQRIDKKYLPTD